MLVEGGGRGVANEGTKEICKCFFNDDRFAKEGEYFMTCKYSGSNEI